MRIIDAIETTEATRASPSRRSGEGDRDASGAGDRWAAQLDAEILSRASGSNCSMPGKCCPPGRRKRDEGSIGQIVGGAFTKGRREPAGADRSCDARSEHRGDVYRAVLLGR
jgi:hypothetical protein